MAMFVAAKFSNEDMPVTYDPGGLYDLKPEEFVVVPRNGSEDVAFVAALEFKSTQLLKLRRTAYPKVVRRATQPEIEAWWQRKTEERRAMVVAKEKARELKLDIKISHVRFDPAEKKAIYHFTSEQRVDFRQLVKDLSALLKLRIELWQIGVRDEARMVDGFGVCGQQTCCSSWLKEFRPITIRMAKDQDINLPPSKLSGQCGRLLCCLSYEVDQYRQMAREALPKGATIKWADKTGVIIDRNLVGRKYLAAEETGTQHWVKEDEIIGRETLVPDQMKKYGKKLLREQATEEGEAIAETAEAPAPPKPRDHSRGKDRRKEFKQRTPAPERPPEASKPAEDLSPDEPAESEATAPETGDRPRGKRGGKRRRGRGGRNKPGGESEAQASGTDGAPSNQSPRPAAEGDKDVGASPGGRKKKRRRHHNR